MRVLSVLDLEGLAINGMVSDYEVVDCSSPSSVRYSKIVAKLENGEVVETECMDYSRISRVLVVLLRYVKNKWGEILVDKEISEEMMSGITYDLEPEGND